MSIYIPGFVVILGSPNDERGNLSEMGRGRVTLGREKYQELVSNGYRILLTGGFGEHFNVTDKPNAFYARELLIRNGVPADHIVEFAESQNTLDDALKARPIVDKYQARNMVIVSSDFHIERVRFIFSHVFPDKNLEYRGAPYISTRRAEERKKLEAHEARELACLRERGESIVGGAFKLDSWRTSSRGIER
jgi:vancomycin permeability regulator SanA